MSNIKPYQSSSLGKKKQVEKMFDNISTEYDGLNRVISFGLDTRWRKKLVQMAIRYEPKNILDIATGTADLAISLASIEQSQITGVDISRKMLEVGKEKLSQLGLEDQIKLCVADGEQLPFEDNTFDVATVAFGVRNFENLRIGLSEIRRVLSPEGILLILETAVPSNPLIRLGYNIHSKIFLPLIGKFFSKDKKAYDYLSRSASQFPCGEAFARILMEVGYSEAQFFPQLFGSAAIYSAKK